jgi:hypothetical protein
METLKARRAWSEVFQALNENNFNPRILYPAKLSIDGGMKVFHDKQNLKQYVTTKPPQQKILQGTIHTKDEIKHYQERMGSIKPQEKKTSNQGVAVIHLHTRKSLNNKQKLNHRNQHIPININTKCQWIQLPHQKTPSGNLD